MQNPTFPSASTEIPAIDQRAATDRLMELLAISAPTGHELPVVEHLRRVLEGLGVAPDLIRVDDAASRISLPCESGNLLVSLPGSLPGPRCLFSAHLDTVPLARGAVPVLADGIIRARDKTALGGDDRTGVGVLLTVIAELKRSALPHRPLTFLFTVREETGLCGARAVRPEDLGAPVVGYNFDGGSPAEVTIGATGAARMDIQIHGIAAHAGVHPERGVSAVTLLSAAVSELEAGGWLGLVRQAQGSGTSNIGIVNGGEATNVVLDELVVRAEARSHDRQFLESILDAYKAAFSRAVQTRQNQAGASGSVEIEVEHSYPAFLLDEAAPVVQLALGVARQLGVAPQTRISNGGLDANWLTHKGIPTVTFGCGQREIHTTAEYVVLEEYLLACQLALLLAVRAVPGDE